MSARPFSSRLLPSSSRHEQTTKPRSRAASARPGQSRMHLRLKPSMISAEIEGHRTPCLTTTARFRPSSTQIIAIGEGSSPALTSSLTTEFKSLTLAVQVQLRELEHKELDERSAGIWKLLADSIAGVSDASDRAVLELVADALYPYYFENVDPCCAKLQRSELIRKTLDHDIVILKKELLEQSRELNHLRTECKIAESAKDRLETELHALQRKDRMLERHTKLMSEYLQSSRKECETTNQANESLVTKMELADLYYRQQLANLEGSLGESHSRFQLAKMELALDRRQSASKDERIAALEKDNDRMLTQLEILQSAIESMSKNASLAIEDGLTDHTHLRSILEEAESSRKRGPIQGLGLGPDVPVFLRYEGWVPYKPMPKGKVEAMCKRIWALKTTADAVKRPEERSGLDEFFLQYMMRKLPNEKKRFEYIYNFVDELKKSVYDIDCDIFYRVLYQELSEDAFFDQSQMVAELKRILAAMEREGAREHAALVPVEQFVLGIKMFFPAKSAQRLEELAEAAQHSLTDGQIDIAKILFETDDGAQSSFMEKARSQMIAEMLDFRAKIESALRELASDDNGNLRPLSCQDVRRVLKQVSIRFSNEELDELMKRGMQQDVFHANDPVDIKSFIVNITTRGLLAPKGLYILGDQLDRTINEIRRLREKRDSDTKEQSMDPDQETI